MSSPIEVLWGNIVHTFENIDPTLMKKHIEAVSKGLVSKDIAYDNVKAPIRTPHAKLNSRKIYIQEAYLEHMWAFIYGVFVMYEEGVQKPLINNTFSGEIEYKTPILNRAKKLYDWSISLSKNYSDWDRTLPNPRKHHNHYEKLYAEKVNKIFQNSICYVLLHEFAHLTLNHDSYYLGVQACDLTEADYTSRIQIENEADLFAFDLVVNRDADENARLVDGLSILLVKCSALIITHDPNVVKQRSHPDLDSRLLRVLNDLNLTSEASLFYSWYLSCLAVRLFLIKHEINMPATEFETAQDTFFSYLDFFDEIKDV